MRFIHVKETEDRARTSPKEAFVEGTWLLTLISKVTSDRIKITSEIKT